MTSTSILFAGVGGQGIILATKIVAQCAFTLGYMVKESEIHGMAQRGGSVTSHVRFGEEVYSPLIPKGKADYLVALEELEGLRSVDYLKPAGIIILNTRRIMPANINPEKAPYPEDVIAQLQSYGFQVVALNALEIAQQLGNPRVENIILLGALSVHLSFPLETWEKVISESVPQKTVEINLTAFKHGRNQKSEVRS